MGNRVHFQSQASDSYEANKAKLIQSFKTKNQKRIRNEECMRSMTSNYIFKMLYG